MAGVTDENGLSRYKGGFSTDNRRTEWHAETATDDREAAILLCCR